MKRIQEGMQKEDRLVKDLTSILVSQDNSVGPEIFAPSAMLLVKWCMHAVTGQRFESDAQLFVDQQY